MKRAVITGIGIVSPFGLGWDAWVEGLRSGRSATRAITAFDPFRPIENLDSAAPLPCRVAAEVPDFNAAQWLAPKDLDRVARAVPLALAATHEALESAGLASLPDDQKQEVDVVVGSGGGGFSFSEQQFAHWYRAETKQLSPYAISSSIAGMISSEISIAHGFRGRSHTLSNGCTSATDALGNALDLIRCGRSQMVISGGSDACVTPAMLAGFCLMRAVPTEWNDEPERASRPFSADRAGFVLGEGAWVFVVEEREHALQRGATLWAEVAGYGATCEAYHRVALNEPFEAARAMTMALDDAGLDPGAIDYVNLHGTGTGLNDPLETAAVKLALGQNAPRIPMSSTKSQIGHPQGASGAAGVAAALAAMQGGFVPATINLDKPDVQCDLDYVPNTPRVAEVESALCNCLGFGSKNAALVIRKVSGHG